MLLGSQITLIILTHCVSQPARLHLIMSDSDWSICSPHKHVRSELTDMAVLCRLERILGSTSIRIALAEEAREESL